MSIDRETLRALVRQELLTRLAPRSAASPTASHPALVEIHIEERCTEDLDLPIRRRCVIEPDRPCYNSGYCKRLGY